MLAPGLLGIVLCFIVLKVRGRSEVSHRAGWHEWQQGSAVKGRCLSPGIEVDVVSRGFARRAFAGQKRRVGVVMVTSSSRWASYIKNLFYPQRLKPHISSCCEQKQACDTLEVRGCYSLVHYYRFFFSPFCPCEVSVQTNTMAARITG